MNSNATPLDKHPAYDSLDQQVCNVDLSDAQIASTFSSPPDVDPAWLASMYRNLTEYRPKAFTLIAMAIMEERGLGAFVQAVLDPCVAPNCILHMLGQEDLLPNVLEELPLAAMIYGLISIHRPCLIGHIRPRFRNTLEIPLHRL